MPTCSSTPTSPPATPSTGPGGSGAWRRSWCAPGPRPRWARVVALARRHGVAVVPQGGNTGLVGGGVPLAGEVVVSLGRFGDLGRSTAWPGRRRPAPGSRWPRSRPRPRRRAGLRGRPRCPGLGHRRRDGGHQRRRDPGRPPRAMRAQVVGVEAVLGTGEVISRLAGLVKDNTGYDLAQLLCGSEGTLGVVTAARLRLVAPPARVVTALVGLATVAGAVEGGRPAPGRGRAVGARADDRPQPAAGRRPPGLAAAGRPEAGAYLLVEADSAADPDAGAGGGARPLDGVLDAAVADRAGRPGPAVALAGGPLRGGRGARGGPQARRDAPHRGDGRLLRGGRRAGGGRPARGDHAAVRPRGRRQRPRQRRGPARRRRGRRPGAGPGGGPGGSISAEHGIGTVKKAWLARDRSPEEVEAMRAIKRAWTPTGSSTPACCSPEGALADLVEDGLRLVLAEDEHAARLVAAVRSTGSGARASGSMPRMPQARLEAGERHLVVDAQALGHAAGRPGQGEGVAWCRSACRRSPSGTSAGARCGRGRRWGPPATRRP